MKMRVDIICSCGNGMEIHDDDGSKGCLGYIYTCANCGKTYRGGFWFGVWLRSHLPTSWLVWRCRMKTNRVLKKTIKSVLRQVA